MKPIILTLTLLVLSIGAFAQSAFQKGDFNVRAGIGMRNYFGGFPVMVSCDKWISDHWSAGLDEDYFYVKKPAISGGSYFIQGIYSGLCSSYHFTKLAQKVFPATYKLDLYARGIIGLSFIQSDANYDGHRIDYSGAGAVIDQNSRIYGGLYAGCSYLIRSHINIFTEIGLGQTTNLQVGAGYKF
jgi:hypothetical protein